MAILTEAGYAARDAATALERADGNVDQAFQVSALASHVAARDGTTRRSPPFAARFQILLDASQTRAATSDWNTDEKLQQVAHPSCCPLRSVPATFGDQSIACLDVVACPLSCMRINGASCKCWLFP